MLIGLIWPNYPALASSNSLSFIGYARSGLGMSQSGETQVAFIAPGAPVKYRLGNEADTFIELGVDYRFSLDKQGDDKKDTPEFQMVAMVDAYAPFGKSNELEIDNITQFYVKANNIIDSGADIWVGRRYYGRQEIHLNDYFWLNSGQGAHSGAGIEGVDTGFGQFHAAIFKIEDRIEGLAPYINTTTLDLRHEGLMLGKNEIGFWLFAAKRHKTPELELQSKTGFGWGVWHKFSPVPKSSNTLSLVYRDGAAIPQWKIKPQPVREDQGYNLDKASRWEINNNFLYDPQGQISLNWSLIYRHEESGVTGVEGDDLQWTSTGIRPVYYLSKHVNLAFEYGYDRVSNQRTGIDGELHKATLALQVAKGKGFFSRPVLRLFTTYAAWSAEFRGLVASSPDANAYQDDTSGWTLGLQFEAWW